VVHNFGGYFLGKIDRVKWYNYQVKEKRKRKDKQLYILTMAINILDSNYYVFFFFLFKKLVTQSVLLDLKIRVLHTLT
jgi:hypothetical protein